MGGKGYNVVLDLTSSDTWLYDVPERDYDNLDFEVTIDYQKEAITGTVGAAEFELGDRKIDEQGFLAVRKPEDTDFLYNGVLGLAPGNSEIDDVVWEADDGDTRGRPVMRNLFEQDQGAPTFFTLSLGRNLDSDTPARPTLRISEHDPEFQDDMEDREALQQVPPDSGDWSTSVRGVTVNGEATGVSPKSGNSAQGLLALFDSTIRGISASPAIIDEIYGRGVSKIKEAKPFIDPRFSETDPDRIVYIVPCNATPKVEFFLPPETITLHPLDVSEVWTQNKPATLRDYTVCRNTIRAANLDGTPYDIVLGAAFLRNTYAVFDFGGRGRNDKPFMQLVPTTNSDRANEEAIDSRKRMLENMPPTISPDDALRLLRGEPIETPSNSTESAQGNQPQMVPVAPVIGGVLGACGAIFLAIGAYRYFWYTPEEEGADTVPLAKNAA
ncbi:acid protease [Coprinopsis marcescibilis]|uniref:Acid protease n=1 Tax=Coprinopsis marcescibilis TaxID=230819 RepID=A0A5C3KNB4_COPMA|nr:acid protease [Coprinopsis marcescibilis]